MFCSKLHLAAGLILLPTLAAAQGIGPGGGPGGFNPGGFGPGGFGPGGPFGPGGANNAAQDPTGGTVSASYDTRTNTVVLTGPTNTLDQITRLIKQIDSNPASGNQTFVYKLKNGSALNIEAVANLLFTGTGGQNRGASTGQQLSSSISGTSALGASGSRGGGSRGGGAASGLGGGGAAVSVTGTAGTAAIGVSSAAASAASGLMGQVTVVADPDTNTLLVTTDPKNWPQVKRVLDDLDRSVPQVLIKVLIAEVSHSNGLDLGADLSAFNVRLGTSISSGTATSSVLGSTGKTTFGAPDTGGVFSINESNFSATIHALQTNGNIDVLSRPYILATDNQLATITVGQTVPYISSSQITAQGNTINTPTYTSVGVLLYVIPHINPDGMVILDVAPEISSIADSTVQISTGLTLPVFNTRSAQTRIAIENGQTAVIGGLMQDQLNSTINKVPFLGDIPYIGMAFQRRIDTKTKTELLIFLTPHVATRPDQLQAMGEDEVKTTKLMPNAVAPGTFQEQQNGLNAGVPPKPATMPATNPSDENP